jgi:hypothetical protein
MIFVGTVEQPDDKVLVAKGYSPECVEEEFCELRLETV